MKKHSETKLIKSRQQATQQIIMQMLDWNEQQYCDFQFDQAYAYLRFWMDDDAQVIRELTLTPSFWAWWRNHWHRRDLLDFMRQSVPMSINERRRAYDRLHDAERMEYHPQSAVVAEAFKGLTLPSPKERVLKKGERI